MNILHVQGNFRIVEQYDEFTTCDELKGDCYNQVVNHDICPIVLLKQEKEFERDCDNKGIFGYVLEYWNGEFDQGWTHKMSCFGFVGSYENENHYIVDEFKSLIPKGV